MLSLEPRALSKTLDLSAHWLTGGKMITDSFDNNTEEIIRVWRNENAKKVDACILTFSHEILQYVLEQYDCLKIGDLSI